MRSGRGDGGGGRAGAGSPLVRRWPRRWNPLGLWCWGDSIARVPAAAGLVLSYFGADCGAYAGAGGIAGIGDVVGSFRRVASWSLAASMVCSAVAESFAFMNTKDSATALQTMEAEIGRAHV